MFLEKEFAECAVGVALHDHGSVLQVREKDGSDIGVILEEIAFGDGVFGPEEFGQVGELNLISIDSELRFFGSVGNLYARLFRWLLGGSFSGF